MRAWVTSLITLWALAMVVPLSPAWAERLVVAVSSPEVRISSNFTGSDITVFGAIERDAATVSRSGDYDLVVVLRGPPKTYVTRKKERVLGIWINAQARTYRAAPSFYVLASTRPLASLAVPQLLDRFQLGLGNITLSEWIASDVAVSPQREDFRSAFLALKQRAGLYREEIGAVSFMTEMLFRVNLSIPANVPIGVYQAQVFLFRDQAILAEQATEFTIRKVGFEQATFELARDHGWVYGVAAVLLALLTGWLAGVIFRRD